MDKVTVTVEKINIPTYAEPPAEELPMFAQNRVHQRTSGYPYPNKVVMRVDREHKKEREYTAVTLENKYIQLIILPEIGGRIYSARDKTTGYDFFYKQHVIKPALIGALGSWISGGVEFNWPFHHRASGFMPCDYSIEECTDGTAICWLSEHDPTDRMKGMVGIVLKADECCFETRMRLYNRTENPHSFLWWENAAVPVNEQYRIFFPEDVSYVNFHYLKSRTTYPIAAGAAYNGIEMKQARDISWHKNTREATSYFASASDYDFFGGYDCGLDCGVVHIGNHHVSPGKKMFTWAYGQLSKSWEKALTDTDGQYAELMAGSYSDNQPDFSWIEPYETKQFSQYWYPISKIGTPVFANLNCAFSVERKNKGAVLRIQSTRVYTDAAVTVYDGDRIIKNIECTLLPCKCRVLMLENLPEQARYVVTAGEKAIADYTQKSFDRFKMPEPISDTPAASALNSADDLFLAGLHIEQYRDPAVLPDVYYSEALKHDKYHIPSLTALARCEYKRLALDSAEGYIRRATERQNTYNTHPKNGEAYYIFAQILQAQGKDKPAYDYYYKSAWAADCAGRAMTKIAMLDIKHGDFEAARTHAVAALEYGHSNSLAYSVLALAYIGAGNTEAAHTVLSEQLKRDRLDHMARYLTAEPSLYDIMDSCAAQTCIDIAADFADMGKYDDAFKILAGAAENRADAKCAVLYYLIAYFAQLSGHADKRYIEAAASAETGSTFPFRRCELAALEYAIKSHNDSRAKMLLGCLYYDKRHYEKAARLWSECTDDYIAQRNLAVAYFSHLNRGNEALDIMKCLAAERSNDEEILYEAITLMDKLRIAPCEKLELLKAHNVTRDDILTELAKAYNQCFEPDKALEVLLSHSFVPCEGGEHAIAEQYIAAYLIKGIIAYKNGDYAAALDCFKTGQVLPDNLGAGIWNHCKLIPLRFYEAETLSRLQKTEEAEQIYSYIEKTEIDYFSNMHLKELPYYQALSLIRLGKPVLAQQLVTVYRREWERAAGITDSGYFTTTPFFIPFTDEPARLRRAQYLYLSALCEMLMGNTGIAAVKMSESAKLNNDNLYALIFERLGLAI